LLLLGAQMPAPRAERLIVVKFATTDLADGVTQWPATRDLIAERLGPLALVVADENLAALTTALADIGVSVAT
jgi:hypothetical protein